MRANGTVALDQRMRLLGALTADIRGFEEALGALAEAGILRREMLPASRVTLNLLAKTDKSDGRRVLTVPLTAQDGALLVGPIKLAVLPPVVLRFVSVFILNGIETAGLPHIYDALANLAGPLKPIMQLVAFAPPDCPLERSEILREPAQHLQDRLPVVQKNIPPHFRRRGSDPREVAKTARRVSNDVTCSHNVAVFSVFPKQLVLEVTGRADNRVRNQMREMRRNRQNAVMMMRIHDLDHATGTAPEFADLIDGGLIRAGRRVKMQ